MEIPEEVLAHIFLYLPLKDRESACAVCRPWFQAMLHPSVWRYTEVKCESGTQDGALHRFSSRFPLVRHLKITVCPLSDLANRTTALSVLHLATASRCHLQVLCLSCSGDVPLFYSGKDLLHGLEQALEASPGGAGGPCLTELDLRGVPFSLNDALVKGVACHSPFLRSLYINNQALVCNVTAPMLCQVLQLCPGLTSLGLFYASLSQEVVEELLLPERPPLLQLELRCERSVKYTSTLTDEAWAALRARHPSLCVSLVLDHTLPVERFLPVLRSNIPLRSLELLTFTHLVRETEFVAQSFGHSLERLILQTTTSPELNWALISVARLCKKLREIHCYCVVSHDVVCAFLEGCPHLWRYTLKTQKERHPWTCTILK